MTQLQRRTIIISPYGEVDPAEFSAQDMDPDDLEETVFLCYFRTEALRQKLLDHLKQIAGSTGTADPDPIPADEAEAQLYGTIRWWSKEKRKGYHAYRLKAEFEPYRTSCAIALSEVGTDVLQLAVVRSLRVLESEKSRVMEFFGFDPGLLGLPEMPE